MAISLHMTAFRLKDAIYGEGEQLSNNLNRFNEQVTGYDKNGNILGLLRYGQTNTMSYGLIDNLNLVYNGNQLSLSTTMLRPCIR